MGILYVGGYSDNSNNIQYRDSLICSFDIDNLLVNWVVANSKQKDNSGYYTVENLDLC